AQTCWRQGRHDLMLAHLERAVSMIAERPPSPEKARVLSEVSRFQMLSDQDAEAVETAAEALALAERLSLEELHVHILATVGTARLKLGDLDGIHDLERAVELGASRPSSRAYRARIRIASGDDSGAVADTDGAVRAARVSADPQSLRLALSTAMYTALELGRSEQAGMLADELRPIIPTGAGGHTGVIQLSYVLA